MDGVYPLRHIVVWVSILADLGATGCPSRMCNACSPHPRLRHHLLHHPINAVHSAGPLIGVLDEFSLHLAAESVDSRAVVPSVLEQLDSIGQELFKSDPPEGIFVYLSRSERLFGDHAYDSTAFRIWILGEEVAGES